MNLNVEMYRPQLSSADVATRIEAAEAIARLGAYGAPAALDLVQAVGDADESVREWATSALENLGPPPADLAPALLPWVTAENSDQAYWAITLLGRLERADDQVVGALAAAVVEHRTPSLRQRAAWALGNLGPQAHRAAPQLDEASHADDARLSRLARRAIEQIQR